MLAAQLAQALSEHAWPLTSVAVWLMLRTSARTAAQLIRATAWNWLLRCQGVPEDERRKLITDAAQRDLKSS